jgi:hypothetical protein
MHMYVRVCVCRLTSPNIGNCEARLMSLTSFSLRSLGTNNKLYVNYVIVILQINADKSD